VIENVNVRITVNATPPIRGIGRTGCGMNGGAVSSDKNVGSIQNTESAKTSAAENVGGSATPPIRSIGIERNCVTVKSVLPIRNTRNAIRRDGENDGPPIRNIAIT
jgi:hypothetical protein